MPPALATFAALFLLNGLLVAGDVIETPWAAVPAELSVELAGLLGVMAVLAAIRRPVRGLALWLAAAALLVLLLLRAAEIAVPWFFGREFNAAVDLKYLPFFVGLVADAVPLTTLALFLGGAAIGLVALLCGLRLGLGVAARGVAARQVMPIVAVAGLAVAAHLLVPPRYDLGPAPLAAPLAATAWRQTENALEIAGISGRSLALVQQAIAHRPPVDGLPGLGGRNLLLIFAESYGAITLTDPGFSAALAGDRARFAQQAEAAGYHLASGLLNAPITGGGSWLAHATLTTGIRIDRQALYEVMLASQASALGRYLRAAGYRTVAVMPRMQQPWPQSAFFAFDAVLDDKALAYAGPRYSWETMPDQFVLERVHAREIEGARQPLFLQYVLASSHLPFDLVPRFVPDARAAGDAAVHAALPPQRFPPPGGQVFENAAGYLAAIRYVLNSVEAYLVQRLADDSLVILVGDHQPPLTMAAATRNRAVPIHVLSRDPALIRPFLDAGFVPGLLPAGTETDTGMEWFLDWFLLHFGSVPRS